MKFRFVEYEQDLYLVVGIGYDQSNKCPDYFVCVILDKNNSNLFKAVIHPHTINIPFDKAIEITDKKKLLTLLVLYG
jgi:hypothetical protein